MEFKEAVKKMREAQKEFYKARTRSNLAEAKRLEKVVDEMLKKLEEESEQLSLFVNQKVN